MNAQGVKNDEHLKRLLDNPDYVAQEKLDGMRAIVHITENGLRIFSRSAGVDDPTRPLEKTSALPHLSHLRFPNLIGTVLDAEILVPGVDSATLAGNVNSQDGRDNTQVKVFVFDLLIYGGRSLMNEPLSYRLSTLNLLKPRLESEHIVILDYAFKTVEKEKLLADVLAAGGEGIMLKNLNEHYAQGGRPSKNWYKAKKSATYDCVVMGFTTGKGKYNTQIGAVRFGQYVNGKLVELGQASGMTDGDRFLMAQYPEKYIGRVVTIKGMERLKSGAIRHPQYVGMRHDKRAEECILYGGEQ
jgi:ATP-dependent DNA ligase